MSRTSDALFDRLLQGHGFGEKAASIENQSINKVLLGENADVLTRFLVEAGMQANGDCDHVL